MYKAESISRMVLKAYFALLNRTYDVKGCESLPPGAKIIAMNHTPGCDPLYLPFLLQETPHFLIQDGLFTLPWIGRLLRATGQIPVYRDTHQATDAREKACVVLRQGGTIAIFPEGRDVIAGQRIRAKTGAVRMALETGAPIIPLGLYAPPQSLVPLHFSWQGVPRCGAWQFTGRSYMRFGAAWSPGPGLAIHAQTENLMDRIYTLVAEAERDSQCALHTSLSPIPR